MRLLNTSTLTLQEFFGNSTPQYAILSHRWEGEEVTFQDLEGGRARQKHASFSKISGCCRQAAIDGWQFAWIDSCCIDKTSSSELSESINSMFQWYKMAEACYVYMCDVSSGLEWARHAVHGSEFRRSKWWTRGWTLQELLAPSDLIFYDCAWSEIGTNAILAPLISDITGIPSRCLGGDFTEASVAQKMSWAAKRETTKLEDRAYSLLGIFNVNMPPLYGEGNKAFRRLQLEILKDSDDESLFAWTGTRSDGPLGLLAESSASFAFSGNIVQSIVYNRSPYSMTNKGLRIELTLVPVVEERYGGCFWAPLNCRRDGSGSAVALMVYPEYMHIHGQNKAPKDGPIIFRRTNELLAIENQGKEGENVMVYVRQEEGGELKNIKLSNSDSFLCQANITSCENNDFIVIQGSWDNGRSWQQKKIQKRNLLSEWDNHSVQKTYPSVVHYWKISRLPQRNDSSFKHPRTGVGEDFVVILDWEVNRSLHKSGPGVRIVVSQEPQSLEVDIDQDRKTRHPSNGLDRTSKALASGTSVCAALRRRNQGGRLLLLLDIFIDPNGRLPWPDGLSP